MKHWRVIYSFILVIAWLGLGYFYFAYSLDPPKRDKDVVIDIPPNTSTDKVVQMLKEQKVVNQDWFLSFYIKYKNYEIKAGTYHVKPNEHVYYLLPRLAKGKEDRVHVTVVPGATIPEIANSLKAKGFDSEGFLKALKNRQPKYEFEKEIPDNPDAYHKLEGYLMPQTYLLTKGQNPEEIVDQMLGEFDKYHQKNKEKFRSIKLQNGKPLGVSGVVSIASMIQKEAFKQEEYPLIAGVIYNRLNNPSTYPYLNIDATSVFANKMEGNKYKTPYDAIQNIKQYNTYKSKGLPPGPIGNPGEATLNAALNPDKHVYCFYTARLDGSNLHYFAKTLKEQSQNNERAKANLEKFRKNNKSN
ncbi:endolytic transglycosylase MltG [Thermoflavimicrobium daqui]|nr:endolytic transglycosylase MltG [Thermoflavimicrobium daqui]